MGECSGCKEPFNEGDKVFEVKEAIVSLTGLLYKTNKYVFCEDCWAQLTSG